MIEKYLSLSGWSKTTSDRDGFRNRRVVAQIVLSGFANLTGHEKERFLKID